MEASSSEIKNVSRSPAEGEAGVLIFNEKRYAVGLDWLTADAMLDSLINDRARKLQADFYTIRTSVVGQHAFGYLSKGHRMGMPSAAAIAADTLFGEWHGIFGADNGWWYIAVHSDTIAPDGDRLFSSEEEAYNFFIARSREHKWTRSYAPSVWNLPDSVADVPLDKLLEGGSGNAAYLRPINLSAVFGGAKQKKAAIIISIFFLAIATLLALLPSFTQDKNPSVYQNTIPIRIEVPDIVAPPPREVIKEPVRKINYAGLRIPVPSAFIGRCVQLFDEIVHPVPGWKLEKVSCDVSQVMAEWSSASGSLEMLQEVLQDFPEGASKHYAGNNRFTVLMPMPSLLEIEIPVTVLPREDIILMINKRLADTGNLRVQHVIPKPKKAVPAVRSKIPAIEEPSEPPFLQTELHTKMPPTLVASLFDVPGLKVQNVEWNLNSKTWIYKTQVLIDSPELRQAQGMP